MKLIIDIPEEMYDWIDNGFPDEDDAEKLWQIVKNGTPLPKGHGRLIDADDLIQELSVVSSRPVKSQLYIIGEAPTIIEADKVESEEV